MTTIKTNKFIAKTPMNMIIYALIAMTFGLIRGTLFAAPPRFFLLSYFIILIILTLFAVSCEKIR